MKLALFVLAANLLLAACSPNQQRDISLKATHPEEKQIGEVLNGYWKAIAASDPEAMYSYMSSDARLAVSLEELQQGMESELSLPDPNLQKAIDYILATWAEVHINRITGDSTQAVLVSDLWQPALGNVMQRVESHPDFSSELQPLLEQIRLSTRNGEQIDEELSKRAGALLMAGSDTLKKNLNGSYDPELYRPISSENTNLVKEKGTWRIQRLDFSDLLELTQN